MRAGDIGAVIRIAAEVPTAPHWPEFEFARMLQVVEEPPFRRGAWVAQDEDSKVRGFAMASRVADTAELEAVVTAPACRRRGIGLALAGAVVAWSLEGGAERLLLEARVSNEAALQLYTRIGFGRDGVRRAYYQNPEEDAMLLSLPLRAG